MPPWSSQAAQVNARTARVSAKALARGRTKIESASRGLQMNHQEPKRRRWTVALRTFGECGRQSSSVARRPMLRRRARRAGGLMGVEGVDMSGSNVEGGRRPSPEPDEVSVGAASMMRRGGGVPAGDDRDAGARCAGAGRSSELREVLGRL